MKYGNVPDWYRDETLVETEGYATDLITDEAVRFLHERKNADRPFYLHLAYNGREPTPEALLRHSGLA